MKNLKFLSILFALLVIGLTSCGDDLAGDTLIDTENFNDQSLLGSEGRSSARGNSCFDLVFPITIAFADSTTATVADQDELKAAVQAWKESNVDTDTATEGKRGKGYRPDLVFPIQITNQEGEVVDIASSEELRAAKAECGGGKGKRGKKGNRNKCFSLVFPITIDFPDGTSQTFEDLEAKKEALKAYSEANGRGAERPSLAYPVTVEYEDGTQAGADSAEALKELKEACSDQG